MKILSEKKAIEMLARVRSDLSADIRGQYEHRAKSCLTCDTAGACCLDEHFVNVRISRIEAVAIGNIIRRSPPEHRFEIAAKIDSAIERYGLDTNETANDRTFACPLYEKGTGCLVHSEAKPLPCIHHACYETAADLPPDELLDAAEVAVDELNLRAYRSPQPLLSLPVAIRRFGRIG